MTVKELMEFCSQNPMTRGKEGELQLAVRKHDKNQLSSHTTVPIDRIEVGFDWTHGKLVLHPSIRLSTEQSVVDESTKDYVKDVTNRITEQLRIAADLAVLVKEVDDKELRSKMQSLLGKFCGNSYN